MKLIGAVIGFDIGTDNDMNMETDARPPPTKKETDTSKSTTTTTNKTTEPTKNGTSQQTSVIKSIFHI
jgi:hypothetical protein